MLTFAWRTHPILFAQTILYDLTMPFIIFGFALSVIVSVALSPLSYFTVLLPSYVLFTIVRNLPLIMRQPKKLPGMIIFTIFSDIFLYFQNIYALFTMKRSGWLTR